MDHVVNFLPVLDEMDTDKLKDLLIEHLNATHEIYSDPAKRVPVDRAVKIQLLCQELTARYLLMGS